jgi:hypothetical protein
MSHKSIEILNAGLAAGDEPRQPAGSCAEFFNELVAQDTRAHEEKALWREDFSEGAQLRCASLMGDISTPRADVS